MSSFYFLDYVYLHCSFFTHTSKFYEAAGRKVHLGGNIGAALLPMLPEVRPEDVAVVELSSFQLISMHQSPKIAVVTNVTPNHLDHQDVYKRQ